MKLQGKKGEERAAKAAEKLKAGTTMDRKTRGRTVTGQKQRCTAGKWQTAEGECVCS